VRIAVVGSRDWLDYGIIERVLDSLPVQFPGPITIVSGGARGVDSYAERWAKAAGADLTIYFPDWSKGKRGALDRNTLIVDNADLVIAFWDGESRGTLDTIRKALWSGTVLWIVGTDGVIERTDNAA
jgi:SLOG family YspA-like protein